MGNSINWNEIIIGALAGFTLPYAVVFIRYFIRLLKKDYLIGQWYGYFASNPNKKNQFEFIEVIWKIKKGIQRKYKIIELRNSEKYVTYNGSIKRERDLIIISMTNEQTKEYVFIQLFDPIAIENHLAHGIGLSLDFAGCIVSRPIIMSKEKKLEFSEVDQYISESFTYLEPVWVLKAKQQ